jgi:hypothetical protein
MHSYRRHNMVISSQLHILTLITHEAELLQRRSGRGVEEKNVCRSSNP